MKDVRLDLSPIDTGASRLDMSPKEDGFVSCFDLSWKEDGFVSPDSVVSVIGFREERMVIIPNDARVSVSKRSSVGAKFGARIARLVESFENPGDFRKRIVRLFGKSAVRFRPIPIIEFRMQSKLIE